MRFRTWLEQGDGYFYHETHPEHLWDIAREGLTPHSYGQSFVGEMGDMMSPDMFDDEELEDFPPEDFEPRTYYLNHEPQQSNYADVLLRFPISAICHQGFDCDPYTFDSVPPNVIEIRAGAGWVPLLQHVQNPQAGS